MYGFDEKAGIKVVDDLNCPVAATTYNRVRVIVLENTEIRAADHDYSGTGNIVPSVIVDFNIGKNPSESFLSGRVDGNGMIYIEFCNVVFQKSDNYRHAASGIRLLRKQCTSMIVEEKLLPEICRPVKYKDLCDPQPELVDNFVPFVFEYEFDGRCDHNNTNF